RRQIRRIQDLDGATIGVAGPGSDEHMMVNFVCSRYGVDPRKVNAIAVGAGMSKALAFDQGSVDAVAAVGTALSLIHTRYPGATKLFDLRSRQEVRENLGFEDLAYAVLYARAGWIRDHRELVGKIVRATNRASEWARTHSPAELRQLLPASMQTNDVSVGRRCDWINDWDDVAGWQVQ